MIKLNPAGRTLLNFVTFYVGWWACALGASYGYTWVGPTLIPVWVGLHLIFSPTRKGELLFIVAMAGLGFLIDTICIQTGLFRIEPAMPVAPLWLVAMWVLWAITFESMVLLRQHLALLILTGAISGPITYFAGKSLNIIHFGQPYWLTIGLHGILWGTILPLLFNVRDCCLRLVSERLPPAPIPPPEVDRHSGVSP